MKRRSLFTFLLITLMTTFWFLSSGVASAHALQAGPHPVHASPPTTHTRSGARAASYDPDDPSDSGCWNKNAVWANWGTISVDGYSAQVINWYSYGCNTNWLAISWNSGTAIQTYVAIYTTACTPNTCDIPCSDYPQTSAGVCPAVHGYTPYYTGGLSPSWTDMVDGTHLTHGFVKIRASATGHTTAAEFDA